jgi:hypothetical protein
MTYNFEHSGYKLTTFLTSFWQLSTALRGFTNDNVGYQIFEKSLFCALHSDIGRSDIRLSPISLITDIRLSAHLW